MIPGIVAGGASNYVPPDSSVDAFWDDVMLLIDASKHSDEEDLHWDDVMLLIDNSKDA